MPGRIIKGKMYTYVIFREDLSKDVRNGKKNVYMERIVCLGTPKFFNSAHNTVNRVSVKLENSLLFI